MDLVGLRKILEPLIVGLKDAGTHTMLPAFCEELGLPAPDLEGSKRERIEASFNTVTDEELPAVALRFLAKRRPGAVTRNRIQEILWADSAYPQIPKRIRREIARAMESEGLYGDARRFDELLDRLWILDTDPWGGILGKPAGLRQEIQQHIHNHPEDWSAEVLFDNLGAYESSDRRFALFLEGLASADVRPDEAAQRRFVACVNIPLQGCGVELRETGTEGGYPVFTIASLHTGCSRTSQELDLRIVTKARSQISGCTRQRYRNRHECGSGAGLRPPHRHGWASVERFAVVVERDSRHRGRKRGQELAVLSIARQLARQLASANLAVRCVLSRLS